MNASGSALSSVVGIREPAVTSRQASRRSRAAIVALSNTVSMAPRFPLFTPRVGGPIQCALHAYDCASGANDRTARPARNWHEQPIGGLEMIRRFLSVLASLAIAASLIVVSATAASADASDAVTTCGPLSVSRCGYGGVGYSNTQAYACDTYSDGIGFYTRWWLADGTHSEIWDPDGNGGICGSSWPGSASNRITSFQACSANGWCKPRRWV